MIRGAQRSVWVLRLVMVLGPAVALLAGEGAGYTPPTVLIVVVLLGALLAALRPEHLSVTVIMGLVVFWWALQLRSEMPGVVLVVAAGLMATHVAATLLSYGPPSLPLDPQLGLLWVARGALAWLAALVVWVVARVYTGHGTPSLFWLAGLAAVVVAAVVAGSTAPLHGEGRSR
ncbi:MAG TPA: hypothetical protein VGK78_13990 [Nocardioides sp.]|uniref:hypothetical protein n=1 Tax=Nocardioides sp. TaxID=35761 RepID=UPI002F415C37